MARASILYVGAHVDTYPLTCAEMRRAYRRFVYVDGSPGSNYWPQDCLGARQSVSEASMMDCMMRMGGEYAGMKPFKRMPCGGYQAELADDSCVLYYFNCPDAVGLPPDVLADVTALYIQGHEPEMSVLDLIPNAVRVYATHWGVGPVYRAVCERTHGVGHVIHEADWDDDEFVVIDGTLRFESDAPTRTQWEKGPASGSDSEETDSTDSTASDSETEPEKQARLF
jgi:hypothetical protein